MTVPRSALVVAACAVGLLVSAASRTQSADGTFAAGRQAARAAELYLAPDNASMSARAGLARAVTDLDEGRAADALAVFRANAGDALLGGYSLLYLGRAQLAVGEIEEATATSQKLQATSPTGYLEEAALLLAADVATSGQNPAAAMQALQRVADRPLLIAPTAVQLRLGRAAAEAGEREAAVRALSSIYFESPLAPEASDATAALASLRAIPGTASAATVTRFIGRGEKLFAAKQYTDARAAFAAAEDAATGDDRDLAELRQAECDFYLKKYPAAMTALAKFRARTEARAGEAEYFVFSILRETGKMDEYVTRYRAFVDANSDPLYAERALNDLAQFHTLANDDEKAAEVFAELYRRFPSGAFSERAAWKAGWWAYKAGDFATTARIFESASVVMPRADMRPAWLYWAARAHLGARETDLALAGLAHTIADYRNTYYGRVAIRETQEIQAALRPTGAGQVSPASLTWPATVVAGTRPPNAALVQTLLASGMYDEAIGELRWAQSTSGTSPLIEATIAVALNRQGKLRPGITAMRRAYPQFMAAGGEALPEDILTIIFPVDHWDVIQQISLRKRLDRFLMAALIAQESTFQADIRSAANAWGLMQIVPATGREYAQKLSIRPFSTNRLIDPIVNVEIGTTYFADLVRRFGGDVPALAAYNAGPSRVVKWLAERPHDDQEVFIDDIPFAETQNYVKRILGTAEDYRRLYR